MLPRCARAHGGRRALLRYSADGDIGPAGQLSDAAKRPQGLLHHLLPQGAVGEAPLHKPGSSTKKKPSLVNDLQGLSEWLAEWTAI